MKAATRNVLAGLGAAMIFSGSAGAEYQGVTVRLHTLTPVPQGAGSPLMRSVFRVYAVCSDPGDFITSVTGSPQLGNLQILTLNSTGEVGGGSFVNPAGGGTTSPGYGNFGTPLEWDTFVTIGVSPGDDATQLMPPFSGIDSVVSIDTQGGWFLPNPIAQGLAGNGVSFGSGFWGVMIAQLTVNAGNHVAGTVAIGGVNNSPLAGGTKFQTLADQTFNSFPAPGGLAVLGLVGLMGGHRRRR